MKIALQNPIKFLFIPLLFILSFFSPAFAAPEPVLTTYESYLNTLDKTELSTIEKATQKYKLSFANIKSETLRLNGWNLWEQTFYAVIGSQYDKLLQNTALFEDIHKTPRMPSTLVYLDTLKRNGIKMDGSGGEFYFVRDDRYVTDNFADFLPESEKVFLLQRAKESEEGFSQANTLLIPWDELRLRVIEWESYVKKFPKSTHIDFIKGYLDLYLSTYFIGLDNAPVETSPSDKTLQADLKASYERFIAENSDSQYYPVVRDYYKLLQADRFIVNRKKQDKFFSGRRINLLRGVEAPSY